jgi:O-antigen ligase
MRGRTDRVPAHLALALAAFFVAVQFYTSLAALSPTPPVGYVFFDRAGAAALMAILLVAALVALAELVRLRIRLPPFSSSMLGAWIGAALIASLFGLDPRSGLEVVGVMCVAAIFHVALVSFYRKAPVGRWLLGAYLGTGIVVSLVGLAMLATRRPAALYALNHGRAASFFVTANQFATYLLLVGFVALGVALVARDRFLRGLAWAALAAAALALLASFSRAGWIGAAAGAVFLLMVLERRRAALVAGGAFVVASILVAALPAVRHDPSDTFNRLATLGAGARAALLFPLSGVGPMSYWRVYPSIRPPGGAEPGSFGALHPHDVYLSLAGETGLVGLFALGVGWAAFARALSRSTRRPGAERQLALAVCAGLAATLAQGIFDGVGIVQMTFVWIPYTALALAAADASGAPGPS